MFDGVDNDDIFVNMVDDKVKSSEIESRVNSKLEQERMERDQKSRDRKVRRKRRENNRKLIRRGILVAAAAAIVMTGIGYCRGVSDLSDKGYEILQEAGWSIKTNVDGVPVKNYVASDGEVLDGNSREASSSDYVEMARVLRSQGFTDAQIAVALSNIANEPVDGYVFDGNEPSFVEKLAAGIEGINGLEMNTGRSK